MNRRTVIKIFWLVYTPIFVVLIAAWESVRSPVFNVGYSSVLLDRNEYLLSARLAADEQWRFPYKTGLPVKYKSAVVAFEDSRFYHHFGIDPIAIVRAIYLNVKNGKRISGGSTLTMQVARMALGNQRRTLGVKFQEAIMAIGLEMKFDKNEILQLYAGHAPFGANNVGIHAASWRYFGRPLAELSWAEACTLAVLPNSPSLIRPDHNPDLLRLKRNALLKKLRRRDILTEIEFKVSLAEEIPEKSLQIPRRASHLLGTSEARVGRGKNVASTVDHVIQGMAEQIIAKHTASLNRHLIDNLAAIIIDNRSFEVLGYFGNVAPGSEEVSGQDVDIVNRRRSTGSTLKPLLFGLMLDRGRILPDTLLPDLPAHYQGYIPENFDRKYRGAVPAKQALASSLNIPAVHMLENIGVATFLDFLHHFGLTTLDRPASDYGLPLILGGGESTLWELGQAYANLMDIARGTAGSTLRKISAIQGDSHQTELLVPISQPAAWMTLEALLEVKRTDERAYWKEYSSSQKIAWKTGTSFGHRDGWAIGSTSAFTVAVWVGNASGEGRADLTGGEMAAPVMFDLFELLPKSEWLEVPTKKLKAQVICQDDGFLPANGCKESVVLMPANAVFTRISPHHQLIHLDLSGTYQVNSKCESPDKMIAKSWFVLPVAEEHYYQQINSAYKVLPSWRADCAGALSSNREEKAMELLYPSKDTNIFIPMDFGKIFGSAIFHAYHKNSNATIYWHLDNKFIGTTRTFHEKAIQIGAGEHQLRLVDNNGASIGRSFVVIGSAGVSGDEEMMSTR